MKNIILLLGILLIATCSFAINPPVAVQKAFAQKFAKAVDVKWGKESATEYEADFMLDGVKMSANFKADGTWVETETELSAAQLPSKVSSYISTNCKGWEIAETAKLERPGKGIVYETNLKSGKKKKEVTLNADGVPVK